MLVHIFILTTIHTTDPSSWIILFSFNQFPTCKHLEIIQSRIPSLTCLSFPDLSLEDEKTARNVLSEGYEANDLLHLWGVKEKPLWNFFLSKLKAWVHTFLSHLFNYWKQRIAYLHLCTERLLWLTPSPFLLSSPDSAVALCSDCYYPKICSS